MSILTYICIETYSCKDFQRGSIGNFNKRNVSTALAMLKYNALTTLSTLMHAMPTKYAALAHVAPARSMPFYELMTQLKSHTLAILTSSMH
jgi:hypothetical protein